MYINSIADNMEFAVISILTSLLGLTLAYPQGPPVAANPEICGNMMPQHGVAAMTTAAPYMIRVSDACYSAGATLKGKKALSQIE